MKFPHAKIAVIGGGVAGASISLYLGELGLDVTLFEKNTTLVDGPPICHLHAGGNLYREISDEQCVTLLKQSIDLLRFFPHAVDYRPTVIAVPIYDNGSAQELAQRLELLKSEYEKLIKQDAHNKVLCEVEDYYKFFSYDEVKSFAREEIKKLPQSLSDWMIPVAKNIDLKKVKYPLVMVQEYGLNIFRIASTLTLAINKLQNIQTKTSSRVKHIQKRDNSWHVAFEREGAKQTEDFDFVINAAGFRSGEIDDMLNFKRDRLVEFKAAYVTKWEGCDTLWPEVIFHGQRGTPKGMAQFTPYPNGYFQLHGMTKDITLFEKGLVKSSGLSAQPKLPKKFIDKIDKSWKISDMQERSKLAIWHVANFIPEFESAKMASKPLYGAQQIPGIDADLRASDVSFVDESYARCEIVKASSVLSMADDISAQLVKLGFLDGSFLGNRVFKSMQSISEAEIQKYAQQLCISRDYPEALAQISIKNNTKNF